MPILGAVSNKSGIKRDPNMKNDSKDSNLVLNGILSRDGHVGPATVIKENTGGSSQTHAFRIKDNAGSAYGKRKEPAYILPNPDNFANLNMNPGQIQPI